MAGVSSSPGARLRQLMAREDTVTPVFGIPTAYHGKIMEDCGAEAAFIGTGITLGNYTGLPDLGLVTMTESIDAARYIASAVSMPLIIDGDTGHGGPPAVRRLVELCIDAGLAGLRLDDQVLEAKRATQSGGIQIVDRERATERYATAVARRDELDPDFVIMAQCYARDAVDGGIDECLHRLSAYGTEAGVDWVQFESPHSMEEVQAARDAVSGTLTVMKGRMPSVLTLDEHRELGLNMAWYTFFPDRVLKVACHDAMRDFWVDGVAAWTELVPKHTDNPYAPA